MKILYVTKALKAPPHAGCMQRTANIMRQLGKCGETTMLAVSSQFDPDSIALCENEFSRFHQISLKPYAGLPSHSGELVRKFHMHWPTNCGIRADSGGQELFRRLSDRHDVVWFHTLGAAQPFDVPHTARTVMDLDDLNHCKYEQSALCQTNLRFRLSAKIQAYKWRRLEFEARARYNAVVVCSEQDKELLGGGNTVFVVPNGFNMPVRKAESTIPDSGRLGFIGHLEYGPNRDGLIWFRDSIWPLILREKPDMRLRIVGRFPQEQNVVSADGFDYLGFVEDPTDEMRTWSAMVVPIPYGGGTRIKILDAFSKRCPVVSSFVGAYGIQAVHDKHFLLTDEPKQFAQYCLTLSNEIETGRRLAKEGWDLFCEKYTWDKIGCSIAATVDAVMRFP